jgi:hypothetical protein
MKTPITEKDFIEALNRVAASKDGQVILACFKDFVNFDGDIIASGNPTDTYANGAIRRGYLYFRTRIHPDHLKAIEFNYVRKAEPNDRPVRADKPSDRPGKQPTKRASIRRT